MPLCYVSKCIYGTEYAKVEGYASFCYNCYSSGPLNLSDFEINLIADSNKL